MFKTIFEAPPIAIQQGRYLASTDHKNIALAAIVVILLSITCTADSQAKTSRSAAVKMIAEIQKADYEGNRDVLKKLHEELKPYKDNKEIASRVRYWRGFAMWRRAINGFNDSVDVKELRDDLNLATAAFEESLAIDAGFVDAKVGEASCLIILAFSTQADPSLIGGYRAKFVPLLKEAQAAAPDNPRFLWVYGGTLWYRPDTGGGQKVAMDAYTKGLARARARGTKASDPLDPSWGEPELLVNLAWSSLHLNTPDLDAADKYAREALALVPNWHYLRDILIPQIREARKDRAKQ